MGKETDGFKPVGEEVLEEQGDLMQQLWSTVSILQVVHPV